jgi:hypothetical protein
MTKNRNQGYVSFDACGGGAGVFGINDFFNSKAFPIPNKIKSRHELLSNPEYGIMQASLLALMRHYNKKKTS